VNVNLNLNLKAEPNLVLVDPTYVFETKILGGQLAVSLAGAYGRSIAGLNGTLTESVGGITVTKQGAIEDGRNGFTDLYPEVALRWNSGVNNWMIYLNFKALWDFDTQNRASGMSAWFTLSFSPSPPAEQSAPKPIPTKAAPSR
jgi:hypothetical protein